jgi:hypothetical protein
LCVRSAAWPSSWRYCVLQPAVAYGRINVTSCVCRAVLWCVQGKAKKQQLVVGLRSTGHRCSPSTQCNALCCSASCTHEQQLQAAAGNAAQYGAVCTVELRSAAAVADAAFCCTTQQRTPQLRNTWSAGSCSMHGPACNAAGGGGGGGGGAALLLPITHSCCAAVISSSSRQHQHKPQCCLQ